MLKRNNVLTITNKELQTFFNTPTAYIVIVVFLFLWEFLFFRNAFLIGEASLRPFFALLPWLFLILSPPLTMGSISQEKKDGTLEILLTRPITEIELLAGKFLAVLVFTTLILLFTLPIAVSFDSFGALDWGIVLSQYLGGIFLSSVFISLGIFVSSLLNSQISTLLSATAGSFLLVIAGSEFITASIPFFISSFFEQLSVNTHFSSISRGVIDLRDLWYFLSVTTVFLTLAYLQLLKRKYGNRRGEYLRFQTGMSLFIGIVILTNVIGQRIPGRIDLTQERLFSLSPASKKVLAELTDVVNIKVFASQELPAQFQPILRDLKDTLRDYQTQSQGNLMVSYKNPTRDPQIAEEANALGIREVQFNIISQEELQLKKGYLGLAISFGDDDEVIPFIQDTASLEYQLTSLIKKLTTTEKKKIGFLSGHGEKDLLQDYRILNEEISRQFEVKPLTINEEKPEVPNEITTIVVAGPTSEIETATRATLGKAFENGKSLFLLLDPVTINPQGLLAYENKHSFTDFVSPYGVTIEKNLVYDLRSNETVSFGGGFINYFLPYPFWIRALSSAQTSPITSKLEHVVLPWTSSITINEEKLNERNLTATPLLLTSKFGSTQSENFNLAPDQQFSEVNLAEQIVALSLSHQEGTEIQGRMVIVGDSDFLTDQFLGNSPENLSFGTEVLSWLSQEESLAGIQLKNRAPRQLFFENNSQITLVKYGNLALVTIFPTGIAIFRLNRRRNLRRFQYSSSDPEV